MPSFWTFPVFTLFSRRLYRDAAKARLSKGFLYLAYLALIGCLAMSIMISTQWIPQTDRFVEWVKLEMPRMVWTPEGLELREESPYTMVHPELGGIIVFDMNREMVTIEEMGEAFVFVTKTKFFVRRENRREMRMYDMMRSQYQFGEGQRAVTITPDSIQRVYDALKPWFYVLALLVIFPVFYVWKLMAALFYSLFGLIFNQMRSRRLSYAEILNLTFFAVTPFALLQFALMVLPALAVVPVNIITSAVITVPYVFFAVKLSEEPETTTATGL